MKKKVMLKKKLLRVSIVLIVLFTATIFFVTNNRVSNLVEDNISKKLDSISALGLNIVESRYDGDWNVRDGRLFIGEDLISYNFEIVDEIKEKTGALATIYLADEGVSTSVLDGEGERVIGSRVSDNVVESIFGNGVSYEGEESILGERHAVKYVPIIDNEGEIVGIWSVSMPKTYVGNQAEQIFAMRASIVVVSILCGLLGCMILLLYSKRYLSDIDTLNVSFIEPDSDSNKAQKKVLMMSVLLIGTFFLIWFTIQGYTIGNVVDKLENDNIEDRLTVSSELGHALIDDVYEGNWSIINNKLYKGSNSLNENFEIVDKVSPDTFLTIFMGDTIVSTNILRSDGTRPIGAKASNQVRENVLEQGRDYIAETSIVGQKCITKYTPIKNDNGEVIGMWAKGIERKVVANQIAGLRKAITQISLLAIIISFITFLYLSIKMVSDIKNFDVRFQTNIN
ncbi:cache domain-containing protein [Herbivorax sp. ANBcel31]|uniref:cache domain-containing protein n=1 Tax=Herbivorax sp. ANBcel31 TaxID=3069754 RepID=UPI0027AEFE0B|nr:cache domain-containing protein [Herbivorax sp. ANBcel31]MDQ2086858.1 cache domain-containing protein [Herbivorax sp. ANBcel31]